MGLFKWHSEDATWAALASLHSKRYWVQINLHAGSLSFQKNKKEDKPKVVNAWLSKSRSRS